MLQSPGTPGTRLVRPHPLALWPPLPWCVWGAGSAVRTGAPCSERTPRAPFLTTSPSAAPPHIDDTVSKTSPPPPPPRHAFPAGGPPTNSNNGEGGVGSLPAPSSYGHALRLSRPQRIDVTGPWGAVQSCCHPLLREMCSARETSRACSTSSIAGSSTVPPGEREEEVVGGLPCRRFPPQQCLGPSSREGAETWNA